jgi:hypothetical protein
VVRSTVAGSELKGKRSRKKCVVVPGDGDPCLAVASQCKSGTMLTPTKNKNAERFFYSRWFDCMNKSCKTTLVMPERCKVV